MADKITPELVAWMQAMEVERRWYWPDRHDGATVPQFVVDEIARCREAYIATKARAGGGNTK